MIRQHHLKTIIQMVQAQSLLKVSATHMQAESSGPYHTVANK
jgi:hypothetical protein